MNINKKVSIVGGVFKFIGFFSIIYNWINLIVEVIFFDSVICVCFLYIYKLYFIKIIVIVIKFWNFKFEFFF